MKITKEELSAALFTLRNYARKFEEASEHDAFISVYQDGSVSVCEVFTESDLVPLDLSLDTMSNEEGEDDNSAMVDTLLSKVDQRME